MKCPHCRDNISREADIRLDDIYCRVCAPEVWALMEAARVVIKDSDDGGKCKLCGRLGAHYAGCTIVALTDAIAALEVKE